MFVHPPKMSGALHVKVEHVAGLGDGKCVRLSCAYALEIIASKSSAPPPLLAFAREGGVS